MLDKILLNDKSANNIWLEECTESGKMFIVKNLSKTQSYFGDWPLCLNEKLAYLMAEEAGINVPRTNIIVEKNIVRSEYCGDSLYSLYRADEAVRLFERLDLKQLLQIVDILVFSIFLGDVDRTVHHICYDGDNFWSIDHQYCGYITSNSLYPEADAPLNVQHYTNVYSLSEVKVVPKRIRDMFPGKNYSEMRFPFNGSVLLLLEKVFGSFKQLSENVGKSVEKVQSISQDRIYNIIDEVYRPDIPSEITPMAEVNAETKRLLVGNKNELQKNVDIWVKYLERG